MVFEAGPGMALKQQIMNLGTPNNPGAIRLEMIHIASREVADASGGVVRAIGSTEAIVGSHV